VKFKKVLFVTWDGSEVTYLENLFSPIFLMLQKKYGYEFHIIQFTSSSKEKIKQRKKALENRGLHYFGVSTFKKSALLSIIKAKFFDIYRVKKYVEDHKIEVLMPRAVNAYFIIRSLLNKQYYKLVFDADGFPLEERVEFSGLSKFSLRYKLFKKYEFEAYLYSSSLICRTQKAKDIINKYLINKFDENKAYVIPNGTFQTYENYQKVIRPKQLTLVYAGSLGPQYLLEQMLNTLIFIKKSFPDAVFKILTFKVESTIQFIAEKYPMLLSSIQCKSVPSSQVFGELLSAHIGISFRMPSFSMQGVAPIKISEYLSAGLSVIYNPSVGDLDKILKGQIFTYSVDPFKDLASQNLEVWLKNQMEDNLQIEAIRFAAKYFSLERSADLYHKALQYGSG